MQSERTDSRLAVQADRDASGRTLLPMLIGGLVLVVVGAVIVMTFV